MLTQDQWRKTLTKEEFRVCRKKATEPPFTGELLDTRKLEYYYCTCCGETLFNSEDKFDSGCGWPSFSAQSKNGNVQYNRDDSHGMYRIEIVCKNCNAHLGHVFNDGPTQTKKRYCVNSVSSKCNEK